MRTYFLLSILPILGLTFLAGQFIHQGFWYFYVLEIPIFLLGIRDTFQKKHTILRNYPVLGHFRYLLEEIRPEIQQYFIERFNDGTPFSREQRSVVYQRAKGQIDTSAFGTQHNLYSSGVEWLEHSIITTHMKENEDRIMVGGSECTQPYNCSRLNVSAMSYGSLSKNAIMALNWGAKIGEFYHNTGEGAVSPYHEKYGGDLVWQIGTGYFGCRNADGSFNQEMFAAKAASVQIKMIELKISQGAKPGHGGMLPGKKVDAEIAAIRSVEIGKDVLSPPSHSSFSTPKGLIKFMSKLRELSGGKPIGFKLCIGKKSEFYAICKAMIELDSYPDFITVDGAEGGTGAAPREFANSLGTPLNDGLNFVNNSLIGCGLRDKIKIIASGKIIDSFDMVRKFALGADICNCARGMMFAVGCIQALRCNTNDCPAGVATQDPALYKLVDVPSKAERVAKYHKATINQLHHLCSAAGVTTIKCLKKQHIRRRIGPGEISSYKKIYPTFEENSLIENKCLENFQELWNRTSSESFSL
jgi:glutamate synthase domain-containing protein 2